MIDEAGLVAALPCARPGADPPTRDEVAAIGQVQASVGIAQSP
jgi:hypothetical protein